jgi:hypothetical protein
MGYVREPRLDSTQSLLSMTMGERRTISASTFETKFIEPLRGMDFKLKNGITLTMGKLIYVQHELIGRGTFVIRAKVKYEPEGDAERWKDKSIVVKFNFTPHDWEAEGKKTQRHHRDCK